MKLKKEKPKNILAEEEQRKEVMARMAATDLVSMVDAKLEVTASSDREKAIARIKTQLDTTLTDEEAESRYDAMISKLKSSSLTINFRPEDLFEQPLGQRFENAYTRGGTPGYMATRDRTEENLFNYSGSRSNVIEKSGYGASGAVENRLKSFGAYNNGRSPNFVSEIRPKYGALNFTRFQYGGALMYGRAYMVLKEHVKSNCTITGQDSFAYFNAADASAMLANFHHPDRLILYLPENPLKELYKEANGVNLSSNSSPRVHYIEVQIHGNIVFSRDVEKICMRADDLTNMLEERRPIFENFCQNNNIKLEIIG